MGDAMNASPHHSRLKVSLMLADPVFVAGGFMPGKMEMECRSDNGLGINTMMVELFAIQELTSRDHSATSTFLHSRRLFQGPGLPPSNAVQAHPFPGDLPLPRHFYQARRGISTFFFRFPVPPSSPSAISFGGGLARVRYELRASVEVWWKGEKRLVTDKKEVDVVEIIEEDFMRIEPEGVIVGENGKIWVQGKVVGGFLVAGETACVELLVKNHSARRNTGLSISLTRSLYLPKHPASQTSPLQISDTLTNVAFRGPEYIVAPGVEGVASLVFDVPNHARGVKGGMRDGDESEARQTDALFEVRCVVGIKIVMGIGSKDIQLDLPVTIVHPLAVPEIPPESPFPFTSTPPNPQIPPAVPYPQIPLASYGYPALPVPPVQPYVDQGQVWLPPPLQQYPYYPPQVHETPYYPPSQSPIPAAYAVPPRPSSAGPSASHPLTAGLPTSSAVVHPHPLVNTVADQPTEREEGKGERASRVTRHLRQTSRNRSVSPVSHRFPPPTLHNVQPTTSEMVDPHTATAALGTPAAVHVHSPRPVLSPKRSFTADPLMQASQKSDRVEQLERMADEVALQSKDLSGDLSKVQLDIPSTSDTEEMLVVKTLPPPPIPSQSRPTSKPRAEDIFSPPPPPPPPPPLSKPIYSPSDKISPTLPTGMPLTISPTTALLNAVQQEHQTPATPLNAVTPVKFPPPHPPKPESGLDALERRLIAEVGTRKTDKETKRADARAALLLPIAIPPPRTAPEQLNDSAISSLTLPGGLEAEPDGDEDGRTHRAPKSSVSGEGGGDVDVRGEIGGKDKGKEKQRSGEKQGKKKERVKERGRKNAHVRVAAWLGGIDPEIPPDEVLPLPPLSAMIAAKESPSDIETPEKGVSSPNPRSSGFVPVDTFKRDNVPRHVARILPTEPTSASEDPKNNVLANLRALPPSPKADRVVSPPSASAANKKDPVAAPSKPVCPSSKLPALPPRPLDREVKYDVRSARGGRGGKVTAVAALWASGALSTEPKAKEKKQPAIQPLRSIPESPPIQRPDGKPAVKKSHHQRQLEKPKGNHVRSVADSHVPFGVTTPTSESKPVDANGKWKHARPVVKSPSIPAISSSHAIPTLSTTASLARPSFSPGERHGPRKISPTIGESLPEAAKPLKPRPSGDNAKPSTAGDLVFGQARLRDLIKKYQGNAT